MRALFLPETGSQTVDTSVTSLISRGIVVVHGLAVAEMMDEKHGQCDNTVAVDIVGFPGIARKRRVPAAVVHLPSEWTTQI